VQARLRADFVKLDEHGRKTVPLVYVNEQDRWCLFRLTLPINVADTLINATPLPTMSSWRRSCRSSKNDEKEESITEIMLLRLPYVAGQLFPKERGPHLAWRLGGRPELTC
jgi:hypothetical protein